MPAAHPKDGQTDAMLRMQATHGVRGNHSPTPLDHSPTDKKGRFCGIHGGEGESLNH